MEGGGGAVSNTQRQRCTDTHIHTHSHSHSHTHTHTHTHTNKLLGEGIAHDLLGPLETTHDISAKHDNQSHQHNIKVFSKNTQYIYKLFYCRCV